MNIVPPSDPYAADYNGPLCYMTPDSLLAQCREALEIGLENAVEVLQQHDISLGRDHRSTRATAELYESDIAKIKEAIKAIDKLRDPYGLDADK